MKRSCRLLQIYSTWQFSGGDFQWHSGTWAWQYWRTSGQTRNGRKGRVVQKFAGINVFDIEVNEHDPDKLVDIIASLEPTFGGVNLEDIKAPECFYIEQKLRERMNIPVFHDDQHGTAIISAAAIINSLRIVGKN